MEQRLNVRLGQKDQDLIEMLERAESVTGMDSSKLVKGALRAVLPCILEGCAMGDICAVDQKTHSKLCVLRELSATAREDLNACLDQLADELRRTQPGTLHGPVQFKPADEAIHAQLVRERLNYAASMIKGLADSLE